MYPLSSASAALHPRVRWHHRSPADPGRAPLHKGQQHRQKPAHLHHILCVGIMYATADSFRYQVTPPYCLTAPVNREAPGHIDRLLQKFLFLPHISVRFDNFCVCVSFLGTLTLCGVAFIGQFTFEVVLSDRFKIYSRNKLWKCPVLRMFLRWRKLQYISLFTHLCPECFTSVLMRMEEYLNHNLLRIT